MHPCLRTTANRVIIVAIDCKAFHTEIGCEDTMGQHSLVRHRTLNCLLSGEWQHEAGCSCPSAALVIGEASAHGHDQQSLHFVIYTFSCLPS